MRGKNSETADQKAERTASSPQPSPAGKEREKNWRVSAALLDWFSKNARDLPWRRTRDPYGIWVSEIMLQQTQVKTVIPYWNRWMKKLPTIQRLARARSETVHKLWEGLGYYTRARNLHKAARLLVREHSGNLPRDFNQVHQLPGIGRYTAGAICSIVYDQPAPILDGNVARVLTRLFGVRSDPHEPKTNILLWQTAGDLVVLASERRDLTKRPCSAFNQSLMELGALICTPKQPKCGLCPVSSFCSASLRGLTDQLPQKRKRPATTRRRFFAFILSRGNHFLVRRRPEGVVNAQLWEFPNIEIKAENGSLDHTARDLFGSIPGRLEDFCKITHSITRYRITLEAFWGQIPPGRGPRISGGRWLTLRELNRLPFASAHKKLLQRLPATRSFA